MKQSPKTRRDFLSLAGKGLGLAVISSSTLATLLKEVTAASNGISHLSPTQAAMDEDYWSVIQRSFSVTRGIINLNNGGVSPSPRIVTEALGPLHLATGRRDRLYDVANTRTAIGNNSHGSGRNLRL